MRTSESSAMCVRIYIVVEVAYFEKKAETLRDNDRLGSAGRALFNNSLAIAPTW